MGSAIDAFGGKWKPDIIYYLRQSPRCFNEPVEVDTQGDAVEDAHQQLRSSKGTVSSTGSNSWRFPPKVVLLAVGSRPRRTSLRRPRRMGRAQHQSIERARARYDSSLKSRA
ncbi:MAG: hypothetical protein R3B51_07190 [Thermodesulfobacteriota bacterium]